MKKKDKDAFLKSIFETSPIKKKDRVEKEIPRNTENILKKNFEKKTQTHNHEKVAKKESSKNAFKLEKTPINKKLKKGKVAIEKKVDFHGLSVLDAEALFLDTVINCYNQKLRCILFVTGKGVLKKDINDNKNIKLYYGKIRENFFNWINRSDLQKYILSVEQAGIQYGADGAFFVYLRKNN